MATVAARRDDPAVVVVLIGPETRQHPDEAAEDERPRRGALLLFRKEGSEGILCPGPGSGRIAPRLVVWFARARGCEHDGTLSLPLFSLIPWCLFFCAAASFFLSPQADESWWCNIDFLFLRSETFNLFAECC